MRRSLPLISWMVVTAVVAGLLVAAGCSGSVGIPLFRTTARVNEPASVPTAQPGALAELVAQHAAQLKASLAQAPPPPAPAPEELPEILWVTPSPRVAAVRADTTTPVTLAERPRSVLTAPGERPHAPPADRVAPTDVTNPSAASTDVPAARGVDQLLDELRAQIRSSGDPASSRAVALAALCCAQRGEALDEAALADLSREQRREVKRFHALMTAAADRLRGEDGSLDRQFLAEQTLRLFDDEAIRIRRAELCREVRGFGVYVPFESRRFLVGREQAVIVYLELDQFRALERSDERFEVRLTQEVVLYNESDGLRVWQHPAEDIVDESRNRRRDFFAVQLIRLPARLSVGKYLLKVRVTDQHGGSIDEASVAVEIVADHALVRAEAD